ncbi:ATPase, T2SS/T4P/T4SS family [Thermoproteota archaeon]
MNKFESDLCKKLIKERIVSEKTLKKIEEEFKKSDASFMSCLVTSKVVEEDELLSIMSDLINIPLINLSKVVVDDSAVKAVPVKIAWYYEFVPIKKEGKKLTIAVNSPLSIPVQDELRLNLGLDISMVLARKEKILELLRVHYGLGADTVDRMISNAGGATPEEAHSFAQVKIEDIEKKVGDASVIKLVNQIILEAYRKRATDIHIEPFREKMRLRYRIDGVLYDQNMPEHLNRFLATILSRIKIMSNLDIVERRIPQDGRVVVKTQEEVLDLRVSFIPTPHGESVVIRILPTKTLFDLEKLGLTHDNFKTIESLIKKPSGIIFVTGPTGSGKSTTLYAGIKKIDKAEKKIVTIEDPVEYEIGDTTQIQVNPEVGLTFARGLRSILRHDPDIIMVGEVRDKETAEIAIRVALTGHLVLSTLHTNDAATGATRLIDIGIEPYLVASSVEAFIGQRLIRAICPYCKIENKEVDMRIKENIIKNLNLGDANDIKIYKGIGCEHCNFTGFYGRTAIYEILVVDEEIRKLITDKATASLIQREAIRCGMKTIVQDGWLKVIEGITTPEEVLNVCQDVGVSVKTTDRELVSTSFEESPKKEEASRNLQFDERRVYTRVPKRIGIQFRLVEKGEGGEIIALDKKGNILESESDISEFFAKAASQVNTKDVYKDVFTTTVNMSAGGLAFESRYLLPVGSILELKIELAPQEEPITCLAKVVRTEKDLPRCFFIAVCYLDISGAGRSRIDQFVHSEITKQELLNVDAEIKK